MTIKKTLESMAHPMGQDKAQTLKQFVAAEILDDMDNYDGTPREQAKAWFRDLYHGGCQSGFVSSLVYYVDTHAFFDRFYAEIEELRVQLEEDTGEPLKIPSEQDLKNWFAWVAFEETARAIESELGLEE